VSTATAARAQEATVPGEVLVHLQRADALPALLGAYRLTLQAQFGARPIFRLKAIDPAANMKDIVARLLLDPVVVSAEPNYLHQTPEARKNNVWAIGTADPVAYAQQWAPGAIRLGQAQQSATGAGVRIAVLDTGVDAQHPALAGRLMPGRDFVDGDNEPAEVGTPADLGFGHGTHVAGLIALAAPGARIMPLRVLDPAGQGNAWVLLEALLYAVDPDGNPGTDDGAHVINMSLGSLGRTQLFDAIAMLVSCTPPDPAEAKNFDDPGFNVDRQRCTVSNGAVMAVAAGNQGSKSVREYPAAESAYGKIAVGASTAAHTLASFSNSGSWIDLAAPGEQIISSVPGPAYATWSGTSMAAPLVAGTVALVREYAGSTLTSRDIVRRVVRATSAMCGTPLRQLDAAAAVTNTPAAALTCP
jgi:subtilisin family serine protease